MNKMGVFIFIRSNVQAATPHAVISRAKAQCEWNQWNIKTARTDANIGKAFAHCRGPHAATNHLTIIDE